MTNKFNPFLPSDEWKQKPIDRALEAWRRSEAQKLREKAMQNVLDLMDNDRTIPDYLRKQD